MTKGRKTMSYIYITKGTLDVTDEDGLRDSLKNHDQVAYEKVSDESTSSYPWPQYRYASSNLNALQFFLIDVYDYAAEDVDNEITRLRTVETVHTLTVELTYQHEADCQDALELIRQSYGGALTSSSIRQVVR